MVGRGRPRKRAPSVSTVATIDDTSIRYLRESVVLKSVSPRAQPDDWPCFLLSDATVYNRDGSMANLLNVDLEGPFIVRGRLEVERDLEKYLVNRPGKSKNPWIQIESSTSFSIGQKDDHGLPLPVLWASGQSGWFEIDPSDKYKAIGDEMFQGINLHYSILVQYEDALERLHKVKKNRSKTFKHVNLAVEDLLFHYAVATGDGITLPEAYQRCADQAAFLLSHFPKDTAFYRWLAEQCPELVEKLARKDPVAVQVTSAPVHPMLRAVSSSLEIPDRISKDHTTARSSAQRTTRTSETAKGDMIDLTSDGQQHSNGRATRTKRRSPLDTRPCKVADVEMIDASDGGVVASSSKTGGGGESCGLPVLIDTLNEIRKSILELIQQGKSKKHPDQMMPNTMHMKVYLACKIKHRHGGAEVCEYFAPGIVDCLGPEWRRSEFYKWAKANVNTKPKFEYSSEAECLGLTRRNSRQPKAATSTEDTITTTAAAALGQQQQQPSHSEKQLAPETAGKQPPRKRGRPSGKAAGLRPSLGGKKRLRTDEDDGEMDIDGYGSTTTNTKKMSKKSRYFSDNESDDEAASSAAEDEDEDGDDEEEEEGTARNNNTKGPLTRLVIRAEKLPSTTPRGPNRTWTCEEPECGYVVRAADEEAGQNLISAHYEEHEKEVNEAQEQLRRENEDEALRRADLAVLEAERGRLPVNHLLEKIRTMGAKSERRNEVKLNGQVVPEPIKRTLLI